MWGNLPAAGNSALARSSRNIELLPRRPLQTRLYRPARTLSSAMDRAPAVLDGTPATFPIPADELIKRAQKLFAENVGVDNADDLADNFRFEFPVVSLPKAEYVKAVSGFKLKEAFPDIDPHPYHWRVDPYEPNRVWFTTRVTATHTGDLKFGSSTFKATGKRVYGAPECISFTFNEEGKCTSYTGGYVMDRRVGNMQGLGALFGIVAAIGGPVLKPGSPVLMMLSAGAWVRNALRTALTVLTFGLYKPKQQ